MSGTYPRAVSRFGLAAMEGRAERTRRALRPTEPGTFPARPPRRVVIRLWLPVTPLFWILSPFPLALAPLAYLAPPAFRPRNPYAAALAIGRVLTSIGGTLVHVDTPDALVSIRIL